MRDQIFVVMLSVLSGCGVQVLKEGTYVSASALGAPLSGSTLTVNLARRTVSVTPSGEANALEFELTLMPPAEWGDGCMGREKQVEAENWSLKPSPAVIGAVTLPNPKLVAQCGDDFPMVADWIYLVGGANSNPFRPLNR